MRKILAALGVCLVNAVAASAQNLDAVAPAAFAEPKATVCEQPAVDLSQPYLSGCGHFYADVDFLLRWFKPVCETPAVVTLGSPAAPIPGALGQPGTTAVIGLGQKFEFPMTPGVQLTTGWDRGDGALGFMVSGFKMAQASSSQRFLANPDGTPNSYLAYQAPDNSYQALPFTIPGVVTGGSLSVGRTMIWGIESDLTIPFTIARDGYSYYGKVLVGGRYLDLTDHVNVSNSLHLVGDPADNAYGSDEFTTHNQFAGPQIGTTFGINWNRLSLDATSKLAAGFTRQLRTIQGSPVLESTDPSPLLVPGPFLALPSNISRETAARVTLVPEIGLKSRLAVTSWCTLSFGYSLLYWNKVLCPGDQMSPLVNITQLPFHGPVTGPLDPKPLFVHTDYFAQGMDFGLEMRY
jgi:hypothetical protein